MFVKDKEVKKIERWMIYLLLFGVILIAISPYLQIITKLSLYLPFFFFGTLSTGIGLGIMIEVNRIFFFIVDVLSLAIW